MITQTKTEELPVREADMKAEKYERYAWKLRHIGETEDRPGLVAYVLWCPQDHPAWQAYIVTGCSLDDRYASEFGGANKQYPEAEYEISIFALNPEHHDMVADLINADDPTVGGKDGKGLPIPYLMPPNVVQHVHGITRDGADALVESVAKAAINGISVDSDFRGWWNDAINSTASHFRGEHGEVH